MTTISFEEKLQHSNDILDDKTYITSDIYMITNLITTAVYVGQTYSHHLNHNKYRPYGYLQRFKDHISAANTSKQGGCRLLNNSIRKHGPENFAIELICRCENENADQLEMDYIEFYDGVYPYGYNLTYGGKSNITWVRHEPIVPVGTDYIKPVYKHSEETRKKIGLRSKIHTNKPEIKTQLSKNTQLQHDAAKLNKFKDVRVDHNNLDQYIHPVVACDTGKVYYFKVYLIGKRLDFHSKYDSIDVLKQRVYDFLRKLPDLNSPQVASDLKSETGDNLSIKSKIPLRRKVDAHAKIADT